MDQVKAILEKAGLTDVVIKDGIAVIPHGQYGIEVSENGVRRLEPGCGHVKYFNKEGLDIKDMAAYLTVCLAKAYR